VHTAASQLPVDLAAPKTPWHDHFHKIMHEADLLHQRLFRPAHPWWQAPRIDQCQLEDGKVINCSIWSYNEAEAAVAAFKRER
jgi:hypothetical protein